MNAIDPLALGCGFDFDDPASTIDQRSEKVPHDEFDLHFTREERGVVSWESVGTESFGCSSVSNSDKVFGEDERTKTEGLQNSEVGEAVHEGSHVSLCAALLFPLLVQSVLPLTEDFHWSEEPLDLESRC